MANQYLELGRPTLLILQHLGYKRQYIYIQIRRFLLLHKNHVQILLVPKAAVYFPQKVFHLPNSQNFGKMVGYLWRHQKLNLLNMKTSTAADVSMTIQ